MRSPSCEARSPPAEDTVRTYCLQCEQKKPLVRCRIPKKVRCYDTLAATPQSTIPAQRLTGAPASSKSQSESAASFNLFFASCYRIFHIGRKNILRSAPTFFFELIFSLSEMLMKASCFGGVRGRVAFTTDYVKLRLR